MMFFFVVACCCSQKNMECKIENMLQFSLAKMRWGFSSLCIIQYFPVFTALCQCFDSDRQWLRLWSLTYCASSQLKAYVLVRFFMFLLQLKHAFRFLRATAGTAIARLSHRNSVCPSVRPSHGWIRQKRCKVGSLNLHHRLPQWL